MATGSELFSYAIFVCTIKYLFTSRDGRDHCTGIQNVHFWLKTVAFSSSLLKVGKEGLVFKDLIL